MKENQQRFKIEARTAEHVIEQSDVVILCMRPQQVGLFMEKLKAMPQEALAQKKWISVLAGTKLSYFQHHLGSKAEVLRAMPNVASSVSEGMTILCYNPNCSSDFRSFANILFGSVGGISELDEAHMDIACAMAASGPGFVFRLIEAEARLGQMHGIPYEEALKMAAQTFLGAARLILKGKLPRDLVTAIATPNGVTQAGFDKMTELEVDHRFQAVIEASMKRSRELSE